jgi:hypothetical protein
MAGTNRFDDALWDRFFDFIAPDVQEMSESEIDQHLARIGLDMTAAFGRLSRLLESQRLQARLATAADERTSFLARLETTAFERIEGAIAKVRALADRLAPEQRAVFFHKLEKVVTEEDAQGILEDFKALEDFKSERSDDPT